MILSAVQSWWSRASGRGLPRLISSEPSGRAARCNTRARLSGSRPAVNDLRFRPDAAESAVLTVPDHAVKPFSILVPLDFSPSSLLALDCAIHMAAQPGARVILLHAIHLNLATFGPANPARLKTALCQEAMAKADPILVSARDCGVTAFCVMEEGAPADVIERTARRCQPDVIILTQSRRGPLARLFGRRTVQKVVRTAPCPVVVLPPA